MLSVFENHWNSSEANATKWFLHFRNQVEVTRATCFEVLLSFNVVTSIVYNPLPAMWKS